MQIEYTDELKLVIDEHQSYCRVHHELPIYSRLLATKKAFTRADFCDVLGPERFSAPEVFATLVRAHKDKSISKEMDYVLMLNVFLSQIETESGSDPWERLFESH